jgi:CRP/FNR family cyclic AMP-dependent transcriptional regulator
MTDQITSVAREFSSARASESRIFGQTLPESAGLGYPECSIAQAVAGRPFEPRDFLGQVDYRRTKSRYRKTQIIFYQGDAADAVFYLQSGKVKTTVLSRHGKQAVTAILGSGDFFGEGCLAGQLKRTATVAALTECVAVRMDKAAVIRVIRDRPTFSEIFISHLMARNIRIEEDLLDQLFNSSEMRLARTLLLMANMGKDAHSREITPKISHETLAEMIGTTRARVSYFMAKFRKQGFVSYSGKLQVHSSLLSVVLNSNRGR